MKVLVVGGAGYVGSHACLALAEAGHKVTVYDDLSTGHPWAVQWGELVRGSLQDESALDAVFTRVRPDAVMHFAARSLVGESMADPYLYYQSNVGGTLALLAAMRRHGVGRLVFSSTAAIFGEPVRLPIAEDHPHKPLNPYGRSKLMIEWILEDAARSYRLDAVALRYFNAAGADPQSRIGETHEPESHLIPRLLRRAAGESLDVGIYGDGHATRDGTCVRDYVHVMDLASAHLLALDYTQRFPGFHAFNLGTGTGYTVREVVDAVEKLVGRSLDLPVHEARAGDPASLVASNDQAREVLGWRLRASELRSILTDAWNWHRAPRRFGRHNGN
jgi:UDP-glucose 4-epimerase